MVFLIPPFQAPDEPNHFYRAQALSQGYLLARRESDRVGAPMRAAIPQWVNELFDDIAGHPETKQSLDRLRARRDASLDEHTVFVDFRNSALYSPVAYLPQAAGLALGRWYGLPLLNAYYLGRLLNLATAVALCYWTVTRLPFGRLTFVLIALCPMFLFEQASFSADALTYGLAAAFCGAVLERSADRGAPLRRRDVIELSWLGAAMALTKPPSAPLPLFVLLLLRRATGSPARRPWREVALIIGISWAAMLAWSLTVGGMYAIANPTPGIDPAAQRAWMQAHPIRFVEILWHTFRAGFAELCYSAVGVLGWLDTMLARRYITYFYVVLAVSGAIAEPRAAHPGKSERGLAALLALSTCVLIAMISYLTWTPVGAPLIAGLQGRYVLPLIVPWVVLLQWPPWAQSALGPRTRLAVAGACLIYAMFFLGHAFRVADRRYWL